MENLLTWYNQRCEEANYNRLGLLAFVLLVQTCIIIPATVLAIGMGAGSIIEVTLVAAFSFAILASLLSDLPSKVVVPLFVISTFVHLFVIASNVL